MHCLQCQFMGLVIVGKHFTHTRWLLYSFGDVSVYWLVDWRFIGRLIRLYVINGELWFTLTSCSLVKIAYVELWEGKPERSWWVWQTIMYLLYFSCIHLYLSCPPPSQSQLSLSHDILVPLIIVKPLFLLCLLQRSTFFLVLNDVGALCFTSNSLQLIMKDYITWQFWKI